MNADRLQVSVYPRGYVTLPGRALGGRGPLGGARNVLCLSWVLATGVCSVCEDLLRQALTCILQNVHYLSVKSKRWMDHLPCKKVKKKSLHKGKS